MKWWHYASWNIGQNLDHGARFTIIIVLAFIPGRGTFLKVLVFFNRKVLFDHICIFRRSLYVPSGEKTRWDQGGDQNQVRYSFQ